MSVIAQNPTQSLGRIGSGGGVGFLADFNIDNAVETIKSIATLISNLVAFITIIAGLWFGFQFVMGALAWLTSGGDKNGLEGARNRMIHAFIGLLMVVAALAIVGIMGTFFGLDILLRKPDIIVNQLMGTVPTPTP